jgi:hypothetical protein
VTTGYVLGRMKKDKLALMLGGAVLIRRADLSHPGLIRAGDQVRGTARSLVSGPLESLADGLHERTDAVHERLNDARTPVRWTAVRRGGGGTDD